MAISLDGCEQGRADSRADRQRQVGAGARAGAIDRRRRHERQFHAGLYALRILTARPSEADERLAPHRLYGHVRAEMRYSVGAWLRDAGRAGEAAAAGRPIVVGGTGLYFKALTRGLSAVPPIAAEVRGAVRARLELEGLEALHAELARRDPVRLRA